MSEHPGGQGEIWTVNGPLGRTATVVVLACAPVVELGGLIAVARVKPAREVPQKRRLLTVAIPGTDSVAAVYDLGAMPFDSFVKLEGAMTGQALTGLRSALKSYFDLHD